jgi:hypothetical protein
MELMNKEKEELTQKISVLEKENEDFSIKLKNFATEG